MARPYHEPFVLATGGKAFSFPRSGPSIRVMASLRQAVNFVWDDSERGLTRQGSVMIRNLPEEDFTFGVVDGGGPPIQLGLGADGDTRGQFGVGVLQDVATGDNHAGALDGGFRGLAFQDLPHFPGKHLGGGCFPGPLVEPRQPGQPHGRVEMLVHLPVQINTQGIGLSGLVRAILGFPHIAQAHVDLGNVPGISMLGGHICI